MLVYSGREAVAAGRRLRELHKRFRGNRADGTRYSALEPEAYAGVHATLLEPAVSRRLGLRWTAIDAAQPRVLGVVSRGLGPVNAGGLEGHRPRARAVAQGRDRGLDARASRVIRSASRVIPG